MSVRTETVPATVAGRPLPEHAHVVVIGSGFAGLGMVIRLRQAGISDVVVLERADAVGGTWRDKHLPRRRLRRAEPPLLAVLRPPRLEPHLLRAAGDPGLPRGSGQVVRPQVDGGLRVRPAGRGLGRGRAPVDRTDQSRHAHRRPARARDRSPQRRCSACDIRDRVVRGDRLPLGPVEPRTRPDRRTRGRGRVRCVGHPAGTPDRAPGRPPDPAAADATVGDAPGRPADPGVEAAALRPLVAVPPADPRHDLPRPGAARRTARPPAEARSLPGGRCPETPRGLRAGAGASRGTHPGVPDGLQADPHLRRLLSGASAIQRRRGAARGRLGPSARRRGRGRPGARRRHDHLPRPASPCGTCRSRIGSGGGPG